MKKINKLFIITSVLMLLAIAVLLLINRKQATPSSQSTSTNIPQGSLPSTSTSNTSLNEKTGSGAVVFDNSIINLEDKLKNNPLPGKQTDDSSIFSKYGKFAFETFNNKSDIVELVKALDKNFNPSMVETSFPSHVFQLDNGKTYLGLSGCTPGNCGGTVKIIIFNEAENKVYMAEENEQQTQLKLFGNPSDQEKALLVYIYFHN